jgi:hypothetical protein
MFDHIAPIPADIQVPLLLDANVHKDGSIHIVLAWDPIVQLVNISTTPVHIVSFPNPLIRLKDKCQSVVIQFSNASQLLSPHVV